MIEAGYGRVHKTPTTIFVLASAGRDALCDLFHMLFLWAASRLQAGIWRFPEPDSSSPPWGSHLQMSRLRFSGSMANGSRVQIILWITLRNSLGPPYPSISQIGLSR